MTHSFPTRGSSDVWADEDFVVKDAVRLGALYWPFKSGDKLFEKKGEKARHYQGKKFWRAKALSEINGNPNEPNLYAAEKGGLTKIVRGTTIGDQKIGQLFYRSEEHTSELQSLMRISYAVFCLQKKIHNTRPQHTLQDH